MMEEKVREAILAELRRQAEINPTKLRLSGDRERPRVDGEIDFEALAMHVVGAVAGGP